MTDCVSFNVRRQLTAVRQAAEHLRTVLEARNLPPGFVHECELAFAEACNNAIQHGRGKIDLGVDVCVAAGCLEMRVWDEGPAFELPARFELPPEEAERGRGLYLIHRLMDEVAVETRGSLHCLAMRRALPKTTLKEKSR